MLLLLFACSGTADDTAIDTDIDADTDTDTDADTDTDIPNEWGLHLTVPQTRTLDCDGTPTEIPDAHWLCTFDDGTTSGMTYLEATAVDCITTMSSYPVYDTVGEISVGGVVESLPEASYDWGGNHHNDMATFTWGSASYTYYHSSFGFGWRSCDTMDCMQVFSPDGDLLTDGCTCDRTLPTVCVAIGVDGSWDPLVDDFAVCKGDDTCG